MRRFTKLWSAAVAACLAVLILAALFLPKSFFLTALSDIIQCLLLFSGVASFIYVAIRSRGRLRLFWTLLAAGISLWFSYQLFWTYHEIWLRTDVAGPVRGGHYSFSAYSAVDGSFGSTSSRAAG